MAILALVVVGATFFLAHTLLTSTVPEGNSDIINLSFGLILGLSATVVNYYFGSSKSSSDKNNESVQMGEDSGLGEIVSELRKARKITDEQS